MLDSNGLMDHPTGLYRGKNADDNDFTDHSTNPEKMQIAMVS